jgi:hypothetical protein
MEKKKDFYEDIKFLHKNIVAEIFALMVDHNKKVVDLAGSQAPHAYIIGVPQFDWDIDYVEAEVLKVSIGDNGIEFDINWNVDTEEYLAQNPNDDDDIGDLYQVVEASDFTRVLPCAGIDSVYDAVYEYLTNDYTGDTDESL